MLQGSCSTYKLVLRGGVCTHPAREWRDEETEASSRSSYTESTGADLRASEGELDICCIHLSVKLCPAVLAACGKVDVLVGVADFLGRRVEALELMHVC